LIKDKRPIAYTMFPGLIKIKVQAAIAERISDQVILIGRPATAWRHQAVRLP